MFLTVTLNAAIDKTLRVANLQIGRRHRCAPGDLQAGGKGINVARALRALGQPVVATGLAGGRAGDMIVEDLTAGGIVHQFVRIADESRSSTIVLDPAGTQVATEIVEYGPVVRPDELEKFGTAYSYLLGGSEAVVLAGSLPRDVPEDWYATALREARRQRVYAVLDSEGEPLRLGLGGEPDLVVPNQMEAEELVGFEFETRAGSGRRARADRRDGRAQRRHHARRRRARLRARVGPAAVPARDDSAARGRSRRSARAMRCWRACWPRAAPSARSPRRCATPSPAVPRAPSTSSPECSIPARCSGFRRWSKSPSSHPPKPEQLRGSAQSRPCC